LQPQKKRADDPRRQPTKKRSFADNLLEWLKLIELDVSFVVPLTFVLLLIFKLADLLILNKTVENFLLIPFQLIIFLFPAYLFARIKNKNAPFDYLLKLRLRAPRPFQIPLMLTSLMLTLFGSMLMSIIFDGNSSLESGFTLYSTFVSRTGGGFFSNLFLVMAYCAVPAFCEELVFRGILCREYERMSVPLAVLASSVFFACLHFEPSQFPVYLFSGIVLALTMYAGGSLIASMIVHFAFNLIGLFGQSYLNAFYNVTGGTSGLFVFMLTMTALLFAALFCLTASKCYAHRAKRSKIPPRPVFPKPDKLTHLFSEIFIDPFIIFAFVLYITVAVIIPFFR